MDRNRKRRIFSPLSLLSLGAIAAGVTALAVACGPSGFQSENVVDSVRVLASRADGDEPYARPGDVVTVETLTVDGRKTTTPPVVTYWLPIVCEDPFDDLYYGCFASLIAGDAGTGGSLGEDAGTADAGAAVDGAASDDGGGADAGGATLSPVLPPSALGALFQGGVDLTPYLPTGSYTFKVPEDAIARHPAVSGSDPYGLIILFNIACTGRVKTLPINPAAGPQQVPIGCFDDTGKALDSDQYVIGYTRVYVSTTKADTNPRISGFLFNGTEYDAGGAGPETPAAITLPPVKACKGNCKAIPLDMDVPASSWTAGQKSIWVDYYARGGSLGSEARLLYDISAGRTTDTGHEVMFTPPDEPGPATIWAVVHDSLDGVTWLQVNVVAQ